MAIWHRGVFRFFGIGLLIVCAQGRASGAEHTLTPSLNVQETYDDNVYLKGAGDLEHLISPKLGLTSQTEKTELKAGAGLNIFEYQRLNEFDTVNQRYDLSFAYQPRDVWQIGFSGEYVDDYTFEDALEESGVLADRSRRKRATVEPFSSIALDGRNTLQGSYGFTTTQYDRDSYSDYKVHSVTLSLFHALTNEQSRIIFQMGASDATYKQTTADTEQTTYRGLVGFDHEFTEKTHMRLLGGAHYTQSEFPGAGRLSDEDETGFLMDGSVDWTGERLSLSTGVNRDIAQSIYGENITQDQVDAAMGFLWTERLRSNLSAAYRRSETDGIVEDEKWTTYSIRPSMNYRITEDIRLSLGYAYTWTEDEIDDDREERNRVFVQLAMGWPVTW